MTPKQLERAMQALYNNSKERIVTPRTKPVQHESQFQAQCIRWFDMQYPNLTYSLFAVPNGGSRNRIEAVKFKREGVRSGVSDIILAYGGVVRFIELKRPDGKGSQSKEQKEFQRHIESQGFEYYIIDSFDDFVALVKGVVG